MLTMFLFLPIDFFFCTDIIRMGCVLKVNIVFSIYLDNITALDFTDNILVLELVVWILHQQLFTDDSVIRDLAIIVMIVVAVRSNISLVCYLNDDLFGIDAFFFADLIRSQILCFLRSLFSIYIGNTVIFLDRSSLIQSQFIRTDT